MVNGNHFFQPPTQPHIHDHHQFNSRYRVEQVLMFLENITLKIFKILDKIITFD